MPGAGPRFVDHLLRFGIGFRQNLLMTLLRFGQLLLDLLGIQKPFAQCAAGVLPGQRRIGL